LFASNVFFDALDYRFGEVVDNIFDEGLHYEDLITLIALRVTYPFFDSLKQGM
jgi:hypothetical protein